MAGRRNSGGEGGGGEERWLLPYADMITLLLGLFIVLFAMSTINPHQYDNLRRSLSQTFHGQVMEEPGSVLDGSSGVMDPSAPSENQDARIITAVTQSAKTSKALFTAEKSHLKQAVRQAKLGNDVKVTSNERSITVSLAGDALFDSGSATLRPAVLDKLTRLEGELQKFDRPLEIAGYTDGQKCACPGGNWGLSADRSLAVLLFFVQHGYNSKLLTPKYFADTKPAVAPPKGAPFASMPANRRIEITILAPAAADPRSASAQTASAVAALGGPGSPAGPSGPGTSVVDRQIKAELDAGIVGELAADSKGIQ